MDHLREILAWFGILAAIFSAAFAASLGWHVGKPKWARSTRETRIDRVANLHIGENSALTERTPK